jgi:NAD(P)-dependent dehydrogenase (short-subunit alcohol dehydrogenase family)
LWQPGVPGQISGEDVDFLVDTNLKATIFTNQAAYAVMRKNGGGRIINFGSGEAVMGSPISAVYAATKGAVSAWTRSIARAWAAEKISAIALAPAGRRQERTVCASSSGPRVRSSSTNRSSRRFPSAARSGTRSTTSGRPWCSCAARAPTS